MKKWGVIFIFVVGLICIGIAGILYASEKDYEKYAVKINGEISDIYSYTDYDGDVSHDAYVTYVYDGVIYEDIRLNYYTSSMRVGDKIELLLNKYNPNDVKGVHEGLILVLILLVLGVVFIVIGISPIISKAHRNSRKKKFKSNSDKIIGRVVDLEVDYTLTVNGNNPLMLAVEVISPQDNEPMIIISEASFNFDEAWIGKSVPVYFNRKNGNAFVDYEEEY